MARTLAANPGKVYAASQGDKFNAETTLVCVECPTCGILYAIPENLDASAHKYHGDTDRGWKLCCPLGHTWWYCGETEEQRLRRQLASERGYAGRLAAQRDQLQATVHAERRAKSRIRNDRDRLKQFVGAGQCPVKGCRRHFKNVALHIERKHPDFAEHGDGHDD
jgi:hypothetical protein